jgi:hypothetical protein
MTSGHQRSSGTIFWATDLAFDATQTVEVGVLATGVPAGGRGGRAGCREMAVVRVGHDRAGGVAGAFRSSHDGLLQQFNSCLMLTCDTPRG